MIFSMALESANRGLTPMSFFAVYNGSGNFGVAIGATDSRLRARNLCRAQG